MLVLAPDHPGACLLRGRLEWEAERPDEALAWLGRGLGRLPHDREGHKDLAAVLRRLGRDAEAREHEQRYLAIDRDEHRLDDLTREAARNPKDVALRHEVGTALVRLGRDDDAIRWFVGTLLLDPAHRETRAALADCLRRLNDPRLEEAYRPILLGER